VCARRAVAEIEPIALRWLNFQRHHGTFVIGKARHNMGLACTDRRTKKCSSGKRIAPSSKGFLESHH
jgi:hypothetical protein